jgi:hypothetical protein
MLQNRSDMAMMTTIDHHADAKPATDDRRQLADVGESPRPPLHAAPLLARRVLQSLGFGAVQRSG